MLLPSDQALLFFPGPWRTGEGSSAVFFRQTPLQSLMDRGGNPIADYHYRYRYRSNVIWMEDESVVHDSRHQQKADPPLLWLRWRQVHECRLMLVCLQAVDSWERIPSKLFFSFLLVLARKLVPDCRSARCMSIHTYRRIGIHECACPQDTVRTPSIGQRSHFFKTPAWNVSRLLAAWVEARRRLTFQAIKTAIRGKATYARTRLQSTLS